LINSSLHHNILTFQLDSSLHRVTLWRHQAGISRITTSVTQQTKQNTATRTDTVAPQTISIKST